MLGTKTEQRHQRNYAGHRLAPWLSQVMVSQQETQRALMTPGEVMQMPENEALILIASTPPIRARKVLYYADRNFVDRTGALPLPPASSLPHPGISPPAPHRGATDTGSGRSLKIELAHSPSGEDPDRNGESQAPETPEPRAGVRDHIARYFMQSNHRGGERQ